MLPPSLSASCPPKKPSWPNLNLPFGSFKSLSLKWDKSLSSTKPLSLGLVWPKTSPHPGWMLGEERREWETRKATVTNPQKSLVRKQHLSENCYVGLKFSLTLRSQTLTFGWTGDSKRFRLIRQKFGSWLMLGPLPASQKHRASTVSSHPQTKHYPFL